MLRLTCDCEGLLYAAPEDEYRYLREMTAGLVFLGTPFLGTRWKSFADSAACAHATDRLAPRDHP
ncbi:hypothetical protein GE09DRAFT_1163947 [Coniochaeta sp. 2T2.1]|nr:hypothetical protein GE09DRAFT_1163947 [Coniochaeta sp. 2T2.1]